MCGITGYSRAAGTTSIPDGRDFALAAVLAIQARGPHATGFAWADTSGHPWYWKAPGPASRVARQAPLPKGLRTLIGHTRWATLGDPKVDVNNHPVIAPGLTLVHNGGVENHAELYEALGCERLGEVDSEALAALLCYGPAVMGAAHPTELLELVRGTAAIAWLDADDPQTLHLARLSTRPLTIGRTRRGDLVMSSTPQTLGTTARLARVGIEHVQSIPEGTYLRVVDGEVVERETFRPLHPTPASRALQPDERRYSAPSKPKGKSKRSKRRAKPWHLRPVENPVGHDGLVERLPAWRAEQLDRVSKVADVTRGKSRWSTVEQKWVPR